MRAGTMAINKDLNGVKAMKVSPLPGVVPPSGAVRATSRRLIQKHRRTHPKAIPNRLHLMERRFQKIWAYPNCLIHSQSWIIPVILDNTTRKTIKPATATHTMTFTRFIR